MLRATTISQSFGDETILHDLSLAVERGEVVAVIGPSGVGKTTLLRVLGLSSEPDDGSVTVGGTDAWAVAESERLALRRRVGTVFQEPGLFDTTVARNVGYGLRVRRSWADRLRGYVPTTSRDNPEDAVTDSLAVVGMADRLGEHVSALSGGEAQRVSFARALAYEPDILLLDEPTSDLDPRNTAVIEEAVAAARDRGIGVVVATHDMHQAERVADRVAVLLDERFAEVGPTQNIFEDPASDRTRKFIAGELVY